MNLNPFCSIIVLNYFGESILNKTINALLKSKYPKESYEIIIVDNGSHDKSREIINKLVNKNENIKKIFLPKNLGFAKGNNVAVHEAKGKYVLLLNNDCVVNPDWLQQMVGTAEEDEKIFAVNSKIIMLFEEKKLVKIQNAGIMVFQDGYARDIGSIIKHNMQSREQDMENDLGQFDKKKEIYAACAAAILYRKNVLEKIGYLDESFFMYYEDVEISERARLNGYKIVYCPKAVVHHYHSFSTSEASPFYVYYPEKGRLLHIFYNFPLIVFLKEYIKFFFFSMVRFFYGLKETDQFIKQFQYLKVSIFFLINFPFLLIFRFNKHKNIKTNKITENYQELLTGKWLLQ